MIKGKFFFKSGEQMKIDKYKHQIYKIDLNRWWWQIQSNGSAQ